MQLNQPIPGELAQPGVERERAIPQVVVQMLAGVCQGFPHHVGRLDSHRQPAIDPHGNHVPQAAPVLVQEPLACFVVSLSGLPEQFVGVRRLRIHASGDSCVGLYYMPRRTHRNLTGAVS
jgi:hypothetical protein